MTTPTFITQDFAVAPALTVQDFAALKLRGVTAIICNLPDGENEDDLTSTQAQALANQHGMTFSYIRADKMELFSAQTVDAMEDALRTTDGLTLAYCKSGMRSAILWGAASARNSAVPCVLAALGSAGFEFDFLADDFVEQAKAKRWPTLAPILDCRPGSTQANSPERQAA